MVRPAAAARPRSERPRLDALVQEQALADSRAQAQALILAGRIEVDGQVCSKPGTRIGPGRLVRRRGGGPQYVSRAGAKLAAALDRFPIDVAGRVAMDVGSSTGGFTDCLLQRGAARVHAIDCGTHQMDERLRHDARVHLRERTNARYLRPEDIGEPIDLMTVDVSFISVRTLLPALVPLLRAGAEAVILVKPQFEAGPDDVGRGGIVRDPQVREAAVAAIRQALKAAGLRCLDELASPVLGAGGNQEYLLYARKPAAGEAAQ